MLVDNTDRMILRAITQELDEFLGRQAQPAEVDGALNALPWHFIAQTRFMCLIDALADDHHVSPAAKEALLTATKQLFEEVSRRRSAISAATDVSGN